MIPNGTFVDPPLVAAFNPPSDEAFTPLRHVATGALELGDGEGGREQQLWEVNYVDGNARIGKLGEAYELAIPLAGVLAISLAFDANMATTLGYLTATGCSIRFFNGLTSEYDTLEVAGATSCRVAVDDPRNVNSGSSDVIFGYTLGGQLYYRQQRDRYLDEYLIGAATGSLTHMGQSVELRLQFKTS